MLKKIIALCTALCLTFSMIVPSFAQTKEQITSNTVITESNINEVLEYLKLEPDSLTKTTVTGNSAKTVGELEKAIKEVSQAKKIRQVSSHSIINNNDTVSSSSKGTVMLYSKFDASGTYEIEYEVAGQYEDGQWTGANSATATIDSNFGVYTFKIDSKELNLTYTPSTIYLEAKLVIFTYWGVGDFGLVKIGSQKAQSLCKWYAETDIPK